jgi:hypothetical protein
LFDIARNADETRPSRRITSGEGSGGLDWGLVEASRIDVITEGVVTDDTIDAELEAGEAGIEVGVCIPVTFVAFGLELKRTANTGIGDHDVEQLHTSSFVEVEAEGIVFVLKIDERIVQHVEAEIGDLAEISRSDLHTDFAEVITTVVVGVMLRKEPRLVIKETAVDAVFSSKANPLVSSLTDVV